MRKWIGLFLIVLYISFIHSENVFAAEPKLQIAEEDLLETNDDYNEIKLLEEDIRNHVLAMGAQGVPENIDFSHAVRIYVDTNIVELNSTQQEVLLDALADSNYVWVVPVEVEGEWCSVTIARGLPFDGDDRGVLTEEDIEYLRSMEGKWYITETIRGGVEGYYSQLLNYGAELLDYDRIIFISSQPGIRMPIAIGLSDGEARSWISLGFGYPIISEVENARGVDNGIYDFETIAELALDYNGGFINSDISTGYGVRRHRNLWLCIIVIIICAAITGSIIVRYKKKNMPSV